MMRWREARGMRKYAMRMTGDMLALFHHVRAVTKPGRCPNCKAELSEKTLVEPHGGIEVEATA